MSILNTGPGIFASFNNINPPSDLSEFQSFLDDGLSRVTVFTFVPNNNLPITMDWYTTKAGGQPQGLDTNGTGTTSDWADLFDQFTQQDVQVGFTFGGEGATANLGTMMEDLNASFFRLRQLRQHAAVLSRQLYPLRHRRHLGNPPGFIDQFQQFVENLTSVSKGTIAVEVGASAPIGTVDGSDSQAPSYITPSFVQANNVYFNVYTYFELEVDNVVASNTPWVPSGTSISPSQILFSLTCNATTPAPSGQMDFTDFMAAFPSSDLLSTVKSQDYAGFTTWIWWQNTSTYPTANCLSLFEASVT